MLYCNEWVHLHLAERRKNINVYTTAIVIWGGCFHINYKLWNIFRVRCARAFLKICSSVESKYSIVVYDSNNMILFITRTKEIFPFRMRAWKLHRYSIIIPQSLSGSSFYITHAMLGIILLVTTKRAQNFLITASSLCNLTETNADFIFNH